MINVQWNDRGPGQVNTVKTTGIYCRSGCAARPLPGNAALMDSPIAAEVAGFRACLRCRPDRLPILTLDESTDPVVVQALLRITEGYLDTHSEIELGREIGISARHLRRLFIELVGATPSQVARSRRAHFARLLLDDTDLTITDIAYAAGFGSVRRMNDVMVDIFKFSPTKLRAKRRKSRPSAVDGGLRLRLRAPRPLEFGRVLKQLHASLIPGMESIQDGTYRRTSNVCGHTGVVEMSAGDDEYELLIVAHLPAFTGLIDEVARCRRLVRLDQKAPGQPGSWDSFESEIRSFVGRTHPESSRRILQALVRDFGNPLAGADEHRLDREFPTPNQLRTVSARRKDLDPSSAAALREIATRYSDADADADV